MKGASLDKDRLVAALGRLGIRPRCEVMAHASLSALGFVEGGAGTVVAALREATGGAGAVIMPSFRGAIRSEDYALRECRSVCPQDLCPSREPGTTGIIGETLRVQPAVPLGLRSGAAARDLHDERAEAAVRLPRPAAGDLHRRRPAALGLDRRRPVARALCARAGLVPLRRHRGRPLVLGATAARIGVHAIRGRLSQGGRHGTGLGVEARARCVAPPARALARGAPARLFRTGAASGDRLPGLPRRDSRLPALRRQ